MSSERERVEDLLNIQKRENVNHLNFLISQFGENTIILAESGIGKVNASITTLEMIKNYAPDCIISTGLAGSLSSLVSVLDVVIGEKLAYHDVDCTDLNYEYGEIPKYPVYYESDKKLLDLANTFMDGKHIHGGLICSGDQFISSKERIEDIMKKFPSTLAVEMESCAIAHVCYLYKVPYICFRVISDIPGTENHIASCEDFENVMTSKSFEIIQKVLESMPSHL